MKFEWQDIYKTEPNRHLRVATWRAKVIGGWIVQTNVSVDLNIATSSEFISDPEHKWVLENV